MFGGGATLRDESANGVLTDGVHWAAGLLSEDGGEESSDDEIVSDGSIGGSGSGDEDGLVAGSPGEAFQASGRPSALPRQDLVQASPWLTPVPRPYLVMAATCQSD